MRKLRIVSNGFEPFVDRQEAGRQLGWEFYRWRRTGAVVLGLPGGGVIVARQIADALEADLDVALSRKMRTPGHDEIALGSVAEDGSAFLNKAAIEQFGVSRTYVAVEQELQEKEILRRSRRLRQIKPKVPLEGRTVILTHDGITTGATMQAALWAVRQENPKTLMVAVPVGPKEGVVRLARDADMTVCLKVPPVFSSVGQFYIRFDQVDEQEVFDILREQEMEKVRRRNGSGVSQTAKYFFRLALERYFL